MSKIQFWKRITTLYKLFFAVKLLWLLCQRYNFESESQPTILSSTLRFSCDCYVKDTILKANHNKEEVYSYNDQAVTAMSKIQFWKRITTTGKRCAESNQLWLLCQRYNFESESQLAAISVFRDLSCDCYVKDTILKANHNLYVVIIRIQIAVTAMSKIQFWKRITTEQSSSRLQWRCDCYVKDTILKANHNSYLRRDSSCNAVTAMSKIQFWKRITTGDYRSRNDGLLWLLCQRYNFESESQQW